MTKQTAVRKSSAKGVVTTMATVAMCALAGIAVTGCRRALRPEKAAEMIRKDLAPPRPVAEWVSGTESLEKLAKEGLVTYKVGNAWLKWAKDVAVTEKGKKLGLAVSESGDGVTAHACDHVFGAIETLRETEKSKPRVMEAAYTVVHGNATPLLATLRSLDLAPSKLCDVGDVAHEKARFVLFDDGWRLNHAPSFPEPTKTSATTKFSYDQFGRVVAAETSLKVEGKATDIDGDAVSLRWSLRNRDGHDVSPDLFSVKGLELTWKRSIEMGEPAGGTASLVARDKWGDEATLRFCIEGYGFRC